VHLKASKQLCYLDNGCSRHMTSDAEKFMNLVLKTEGYVTYGDNNKGRILGHGDIGDGYSIIQNVLYCNNIII